MDLSELYFAGMSIIGLLLLWSFASWYKRVTRKFPYNWCSVECWPEDGQESPCKDCPYLRKWY